MRLGLLGVDSSHAEDFLRHINAEQRHDGMRITALWGDDIGRVDALCAIAPELMRTGSPRALAEAVDAVIVGDRHGALHREHARIAIAAGKPVFVDKPLANSLADAEVIVTTAERAGVPLLSGSALRWQTETKRLKARLAGLDEPIELHAYGTWYPQNEYGGAIFYAIHTIELAQELLGSEWRKLSRCEGTNPKLHYRSGEHAVTLEFRPLSGESSDFGVRVKSGKVAFQQPIPLGDDYMLPVVEQIAAMLRTGKSSMAREALLAPVALMAEIDALLKTTA